MKHPFLIVFLPILLLLLAPTDARAQEAEPIPLGEKLSIHSEVLQEKRPVLVYKPSDYDQSDTHYPVLYLLDGDAHLLHTAGITQFLSQNGKMPPVLIIGLPNTDRTRDLTPPADDERFPTAGGADTFLAFIADELMPFVETRYRTAPYKILVGHSFGGLFSVHALLTRPDLFDAHIAISPSMWWDNKGLLPIADAFFDTQPDLNAFMYMTMGNEGGSMLGGAWGLAGIFEEKAPDTFTWHFELMEEETHGSIPHRSTYDGLEMLYAGWDIANPMALFEKGGLAAIDAHFASLSERFGYAIPTPENLVNQLGYGLLGQGRAQDAIAVFTRNVEAYPASINAYDSLGDGYDAAEEHDKAKAAYETACTRARTANHPNTSVYCGNLERLKKQLGNR